MLPYLRIILIILLIGSIYWAITRLKKPITPMSEAFENDIEEDIENGDDEEHDSNNHKTTNNTKNIESKPNTKYSNNLISNGSFSHGKDITQKNGESGNNRIIRINNPGNSSFALRQSSFSRQAGSHDLDTYYRIKLHLTPGQHYRLNAWVATTKNWNGKDNVFNLKFLQHGSNNVIMTGNGDVISTTEIGHVEVTDVITPMTWKNHQFSFHVPHDVDGTIELYIGYKPENTLGYRYVTGLSLKNYYPAMSRLPVTQWLQCVLDGSHPMSRGQPKDVKWTDLTGKGHDFEWSSVPKWNMKGFYKTVGNKLTGPDANKFNINESVNDGNFTVMLKFRNNKPPTKNEKDQTLALFIPGNQTEALKLLLPNRYGKVKVIAGGHQFSTKESVLTTNKCVITLVCYQNVLSIFYNDTLLQRNEIPKLYFGHSPVTINPSFAWDSQIYNVVIYNQALPLKRIALMIDYLAAMDYHYDDSKENKDSDMHMFHNQFYQDQGNHNYLVPNTVTYNFDGQPPQHVNESHHNQQQTHHKQTQPKQTHHKQNQHYKRTHHKQNHHHQFNYPTVQLNGLDYIVTINQNSEMAHQMGYWGSRNYGSDRNGAAIMYQMNFPMCPVPQQLRPLK